MVSYGQLLIIIFSFFFLRQAFPKLFYSRDRYNDTNVQICLAFGPAVFAIIDSESSCTLNVSLKCT